MMRWLYLATAFAMILIGLWLIVGPRRTKVIIIRPNQTSSEAVIKRGEIPGWIEVWQNGELIQEWQSKDGSVYQVLDSILNGEMPIEEVEEKDKLSDYLDKTA